MHKTPTELDGMLRQAIAMQIEETIRIQSRGVWYPFLAGVLLALCGITMGIILSVGLTHVI